MTSAQLELVPAPFDPLAPIARGAGLAPYSCMIVWRSCLVAELRDYLEARRWQG